MFGLRSNILLKEWWWVIAIALGSYAFHIGATHQKAESITQLEAAIAKLNLTKDEALARQDELKMRIESQKDPEWIKMMLMQGLGLAPEGSVKVRFEEIDPDQ